MRLAAERDDPRAGRRGDPVEAGGGVAKHPFGIVSLQSPQDMPDRGGRGRPFPKDPEGLVQASPANLDEGPEAAIRIGAGRDRQDRKQQDMREPGELASGAARIGDRRALRKEGVRRLYGNLR